MRVCIAPMLRVWLYVGGLLLSNEEGVVLHSKDLCIGVGTASMLSVWRTTISSKEILVLVAKSSVPSVLVQKRTIRQRVL